MSVKINKKIIAESDNETENKIASFMKHYNLTREEAISAIDLFDEYLTSKYTYAVLEMVLNSHNHVRRPGTVRQIKMGIRKDTLVFNAMLKYAMDRKAAELESKKLLAARS